MDRRFWPGVVTCLTVGTSAEASDIRVSRSMFSSKGVTGEPTRCHRGIDCESREVVLVKDVGRAEISGVETEGVILGEPTDAEVRNIPELVCHGDVVHVGKTACFLFV